MLQAVTYLSQLLRNDEKHPSVQNDGGGVEVATGAVVVTDQQTRVVVTDVLTTFLV